MIDKVFDCNEIGEAKMIYIAPLLLSLSISLSLCLCPPLTSLPLPPTLCLFSFFSYLYFSFFFFLLVAAATDAIYFIPFACLHVTIILTPSLCSWPHPL